MFTSCALERVVRSSVLRLALDAPGADGETDPRAPSKARRRPSYEDKDAETPGGGFGLDRRIERRR